MKEELGRKDDLWSFFFVILEFLEQPLPWKQNTDKDQVKEIKRSCFERPTSKLFPNLHSKHSEIHSMFNYLKSLSYAD